MIHMSKRIWFTRTLRYWWAWSFRSLSRRVFGGVAVAHSDSETEREKRSVNVKRCINRFNAHVINQRLEYCAHDWRTYMNTSQPLGGGDIMLFSRLCVSLVCNIVRPNVCWMYIKLSLRTKKVWYFLINIFLCTWVRFAPNINHFINWSGSNVQRRQMFLVCCSKRVQYTVENAEHI